MSVYLILLTLLFTLLAFLLVPKMRFKKKLRHKSWIEQIETIARENEILWASSVPFFQKGSVAKELLKIEESQKEEGIELKMSNSGGWHSSSDLLHYPFMKKLFKKLIPTIEAYARAINLDPNLLTITAWANINRGGNSNIRHTHEDALFSGCYYLQIDDEKEDAGQVTFYGKQKGNKKRVTFNPHSGDLILFPSDMQHEVFAHQNASERITIAFNLHYGDKKRSWMVSNLSNISAIQKLDPTLESLSSSNAPNYVDISDRKSMLFHISKFKRKISN